MRTLEELIDEAMASGDWYGITIFAGKHADHPTANLLRDVATAQCDQITDPTVPASVRLRTILEANLRPALPASLFDDLLG